MKSRSVIRDKNTKAYILRLKRLCDALEIKWSFQKMTTSNITERQHQLIKELLVERLTISYVYYSTQTELKLLRRQKLEKFFVQIRSRQKNMVIKTRMLLMNK